MLRKIALSLLMLVSLIVTLPLVNSTAHSIKYEAAHNQRRVRRHSKAWWRRHRALMRRRRAARLRRRALAAAMRRPNGVQDLRTRQLMIQTSDNHAGFSTTVSLPPATLRDANGITLPLPEGWSAVPLSNTNETKFRVVETNGNSAGQAALSIVSAAAPNAGRLSVRDRNKVVAGVSYVELRRTVIDKMVTSGGWVVNDVERDLAGRKVFVVVAQTPATNDGRSPEQIWNFYFTEVDGRVYSLATSAPRQSSDRLAIDAEKFITSLKPATPASPRISIR